MANSTGASLPPGSYPSNRENEAALALHSLRGFPTSTAPQIQAHQFGGYGRRHQPQNATLGQRRALQQLPANVYTGYYGPAPAMGDPPNAFACGEVASSGRYCDPSILRNGPGPDIHEPEHSTMQQLACGEDLISPNSDGLNIGGLRLSSPYGHAIPLPRKHLRLRKGEHLEGARIIPSAPLMNIFEDLEPNEVVLFFGWKGTMTARIEKDLLCCYSGYFSDVFDALLGDGPEHIRSILESHTRIIRLRGDFPFAVRAMINFIVRGIYPFEQEMVYHHPYITMLDLHVHAYIVAEKYKVPKLADYALNKYTTLAYDIVTANFHVDIPAVHNVPQDAYGRLMWEAYAPQRLLSTPRDACDRTPNAQIDRFLDSVVLLWRNTKSDKDAMRKVVLELVKMALPKFMRMRFFNTMVAGLEGFAGDLEKSLGEDGIEVEMGWAPINGRYGVNFGGSGE